MSDSIGRIGRHSGAHLPPELAGEGRIAADRDGLARLVLELGDEVKACVEMMSGALWVRDELVACGWQVQVADAQGEDDRAAGGENGQGRRAPARRALPPRAGAGALAALAQRAGAAGTATTADAPGAATDQREGS